ncbi:class I SAM-dependent methyltransferase [Granulicoccus phenolivorans]|uniref:class I SAM-dependent methyltransferase n=1 Tax=Granulicoccus phenolivorans TaxID=266854 RepID=UPI000412E077|nr:class I SAM-dependent methyltransferase [Granulicoccus phenolivorans]
MSERIPSHWDAMVAANPGHSAAYAQRFRDMAAAGLDLLGEARLVDAMLPRGARVLDAGCGPGRHAGYLARAGHVVIGVDGDAELIRAAAADHPGPTYLVGDLAELDLPARGIAADFDAILCAGNVMTFLAESTRRTVLAGFARHLSDTGRAIIGFGAGRGYAFDAFFADAIAAGLRVELTLSTWDLRAFTPDADFLVAILSRETTTER